VPLRSAVNESSDHTDGPIAGISSDHESFEHADRHWFARRLLISISFDLSVRHGLIERISE